MIKKKYTLITGSTGYLGRTISENLSKSKINLIITDINKNNLIKLKEKLKKKYSNDVKTIVCDLEKLKSRDTLINFVKKNKYNVDCLINNAAFVGTSKLKGWNEKFDKQSLETWNRCIEVNLNSVFHLCKELSPILKKQKNANIVNIASMYGFLAPDLNLYSNTNINNPAAYSTSKAGIIYLTKWLASTLAPNIRVNSISPGGIFRDQDKRFIKKYINSTPLKRMAKEEDFIGIIRFLSSEMSSYITGQNIIVDGGRSII